ncbi:hypothetical protein M9H77_27872 [Catharanthus roseus]|uniref:Uncharacterized protein n=1 Tax=Catharanthus roseus TaxID=4058 RepID=A0ACC0AE47_CATRO|nr:hypothetical protein M9H77_27872 [Catharanthus roseus]
MILVPQSTLLPQSPAPQSPPPLLEQGVPNEVPQLEQEEGAVAEMQKNEVEEVHEAKVVDVELPQQQEAHPEESVGPYVGGQGRGLDLGPSFTIRIYVWVWEYPESLDSFTPLLNIIGEETQIKQLHDELANVPQDKETLALALTSDFSLSSSLQFEEKQLQLLSDCRFVINGIGSDISMEEGTYVYNLLLEYDSGGSLDNLIIKSHNNNNGGKKHMSESQIASYAFMLLKGLSSIHKKGIVHCDFKPANILIIPVRNGINLLKIADFDLSKIARDVGSNGKSRCTPFYASPESYLWGLNEKSGDIWSSKNYADLNLYRLSNNEIKSLHQELVLSKKPWMYLKGMFSTCTNSTTLGPRPSAAVVEKVEGADDVVNNQKKLLTLPHQIFGVVN